MGKQTFVLLIILIIILSGCSSVKTRKGIEKYSRGNATWYGHNDGHGTDTASGEKFDDTKMTAAHRTFPFGTIAKVTNVKNKKSVIVRINDRGPFVYKYMIDLSYGAFAKIADPDVGFTEVTVEVLE